MRRDCARLKPTSPSELVNWIHYNYQKDRDITIEFRGPKGAGKSACIFFLRKWINPKVRGFDDLVISHRDYVDSLTRIENERNTGNRELLFLWVDDATRLFDRRAHATRQNRAVLTMSRTMRDNVNAIQLLATQDDLLEKPIMKMGPYALLVFGTDYTAQLWWPRFTERYEGQINWSKGFKMRWPNPAEKWPVEWLQYQNARRAKRAILNEELKQEILGEGKEGVQGEKGEDPRITRALEILQNGGSVNEAALEVGAAWNTVARWARQGNGSQLP